jgi:hypothetical protein
MKASRGTSPRAASIAAGIVRGRSRYQHLLSFPFPTRPMKPILPRSRAAAFASTPAKFLIPFGIALDANFRTKTGENHRGLIQINAASRGDQLRSPMAARAVMTMEARWQWVNKTIAPPRPSLLSRVPIQARSRDGNLKSMRLGLIETRPLKCRLRRRGRAEASASGITSLSVSDFHRATLAESGSSWSAWPS